MMLLLLFCSCRKGSFRQPSQAEPGERTDEQVYKMFINRAPDDRSVAIFRSDLAGHPQNGACSLGGRTDSTFTHLLRLNGRTFTPRHNGQWFELSEFLDSLFGKKVLVEFRTGLAKYSQEIYIPKPPASTFVCTFEADPLLGPVIRRTGNVLRWQPDRNAECKSMLLHFMLINEMGGIIKSENKFLPNNGVFVMDGILQDERIRHIDFELISGSCMEVPTVRKGRLFFGAAVFDHHEYHLK